MPWPETATLFEQFKERLAKNGVPPADHLKEFAEQVKVAIEKGKTEVEE